MRILLSITLILFTLQLSAQRLRYFEEARNNEGAILPINVMFGSHFPGGDLADRFGNSLSVGGGVDYLTSKDYLIGLQSHFIFGKDVHTDVLSNLRNSDGLIFGDDGSIADIKLKQRGIYIGGHIGRIFRLKPEQRSGIRLTVGAGLWQHKIRVQDDPQVFMPQLSDAYKKGYDRLSNGLALTQFIGYQYLGKMRRLNFFAGFEFAQGFTQNRRSFNFDTREEDNESRLDLSYGIRLGWVLPLYIGENADEIRY